MAVMVLVGVGAHPASDVPLVYATLEPKQIAMGESARLTITSLGNPVPLALPKVSGLQFDILGRTHEVQLVNGTPLASSSLVVRVTPLIAGTFTIPPVTPELQPLVLQVSADHGPAGSTGPGNSNYLIRPPVLPNAPAKDGLRLTADGSAFVRLGVPTRAVYVGESVPVDIEVGMRAGFVTSLNGLPTLNGGEFTLNNLSRQPDRTERAVDGKPFTILTWHSVLAAVKPGEFSLAIETPLTVKISTRPKKDAQIDDLLGDPFMQNFFGATVSRDITVTSPPTDLKVLALPLEGRPADFSGAVGTFKIASEISPAASAAGDPITLRMRLRGSGNFDRVDSAMLGHLDDWKTYPPKSSFKASDAIGYSGEKTFEQPLIALKPSAQTLPGLTFSYFDPVLRRYETARSTPITVNITPTDTMPGDTPAGTAMAANRASSPLRPDHAVAGGQVKSLIPLYMQPRFLVIPSVLAFAFASGLIGLRRRGSTPQGAARKRATSKAGARELERLDAVARAGDTAAFLDAARATLQRSLGARWRLAPEEVTGDEVSRRLGQEGDEIRQLLFLADETRYAENKRVAVDFARWTRVVRRALEEKSC
jgi:oxygen tolerance protein BatD